MTKAPRPGQVKTRLNPPLNQKEAAQINQCFLRDIAASISKAGENSQGIACYTPLGAEESYREILPVSFCLLPQREGVFGQRLFGAVEDLLAVGFESVCLINSDSPTVPASSFQQAINILAAEDDTVVLGPSEDGGYYLIGMRKVHRHLFQNIAWSTEKVLIQTLERAAELSLNVRLLPVGYDVDDQVAFERLCHDLSMPNESNNESAPATRRFVQHWLQQAHS